MDDFRHVRMTQCKVIGILSDRDKDVLPIKLVMYSIVNAKITRYRLPMITFLVFQQITK